MKTEHPAPAADIGHGVSVLPTTRLPAGVHPGFVVGESDRIHDTRTVAWAIHTRAEFKVGERDFSGSCCLHEAVLMRRLYDESGGGSVRLDAAWPPGLNRLVPLTQEQLERELGRFKATFTVPKEHGSTDLTAQYLGAESGEQLRRLHEIMRKQLEAWTKCLEVAKTRIPKEALAGLHPEVIQSMACDHITPRELEEIANLADPSRDGIDGVQLPEVAAPKDGIPYNPKPISQAEAQSLQSIMDQAEREIDSQEPDKAQALIERLKAAGADETQAVTLASLVELAGGVDLSDEDIAKEIGSNSKAKLANIRKALRG